MRVSLATVLLLLAAVAVVSTHGVEAKTLFLVDGNTPLADDVVSFSRCFHVV